MPNRKPMLAAAKISATPAPPAIDFDTLVHAVDALSDEQRLELFSHYCKYCGGKDPKCHCWNDD